MIYNMYDIWYIRIDCFHVFVSHPPRDMVFISIVLVASATFLPGVVLIIFDGQSDALRALVAKQLKNLSHSMRTLYITYLQDHVERCNERLKSATLVNCLEQVLLVTASSLKLPTRPRRSFGTGTNKGNVLCNVPLVDGGQNGWQTPCEELVEDNVWMGQDCFWNFFCDSIKIYHSEKAPILVRFFGES